jgi:hypothetical protein
MEVKWIHDDQLNNEENDKVHLKVEIDQENEHEIIHLLHEISDLQMNGNWSQIEIKLIYINILLS